MKAKRTDIQGLRALAVTLVVVYHLWPGRLTGGYVGVDVFFVISGFLITGHLVSELGRTGTISLTAFWARRIRRLLPAAFVVLGFSLVAAFIWIPKSLLQQTVSEIGASVIYMQNWALDANSVNYLASDNQASLVQHFWSLSVEEQFYVIWPLLLLGVVWIFRKAAVSPSSRIRVVGVALIAVLVLSLAYSIYEVGRGGGGGYFSTATRAWEFALGGLVFLLPPTLKRSPLSEEVRAGISWAGVALILIGALTFTAATPFPGYAALLPVLGAAVFLYAGDSLASWAPARAFDFRPIQFIGDSSYAIYLWHWPLLTLFPFVFSQDLTFRTRILVLAITILLAYLTQRYVESPVRNARGRARGRRPAYAFMAAGIVAILTVTSVSAIQFNNEQTAYAAEMSAQAEQAAECFGAASMAPDHECDDRFAVTSTVVPSLAAADTYWVNGVSSENPCAKAALAPDAPMVPCDFGVIKDPSRTIALVGDSHADVLLNPLVAYGESRGWKIVTYTRGGCSGLESSVADAGADAFAASCSAWAGAVRSDIMSRSDIDVVLFANRTSKYPNLSGSSVAAIWNDLRASGNLVVAVDDVPALPDGVVVPECIEKSGQGDDPCAWIPAEFSNFMSEAGRSGETSTPVIDLNSFFCLGSKCHSVIGGVVVYFDDSHLSFTFAQTLAPYLGAELDRVVAETDRGSK